jgi:hypothetical protein
VALKSGPLTRDDLQAIWEGALDKSYKDPFLAAGMGNGLEAHGQMWEIFARVSRAVDRTTQALFIVPWSGQSDSPAGGARKSLVTLTFARTLLIEQPMVLKAGQIFAEENQVDWGPDGGVPVLTGRRYALLQDLVFHPGDAGPLDVLAEAENPGYGYDNPLPGTIDSVSQPGADFDNVGASVVATIPLVVPTTPFALARVDTPDIPDTFIPGQVGQYVRFVAGANAGRAGRITTFVPPDTTTFPPKGSTVYLEIDVSVEATAFAGTFLAGEVVDFKNGGPALVRGTVVGERTAGGVKKLTVVFLSGDVSTLTPAVTTATGAASGATLTVSRVAHDPLFSSETGTASWSILGWARDWGLSVTNVASPTGGRAAMLDALGRERALDRSSGEDDDTYRKRVHQIADVVTPNAIRRTLNRVMGALPWCFREVGSPLLPGFFYDGDLSPVHFVPAVSSNDAWDVDALLLTGPASPAPPFLLDEPVWILDGAMNLYATGWFGRMDGAGPFTLVFIRRGGTVPTPIPAGLFAKGLVSGVTFSITGQTANISFASRRFRFWLDYTEFRAFFLVGVPRLGLNEFGFAWAPLPAGSPGYSTGAFDASPYLAFYDGFPYGDADVYGKVAQALNAVKAGGVGFDLYVEDGTCT